MSNIIKRELEKIEIPKELHEKSKLGVMKAKQERSKSKLKKLVIPVVASATILFSTGVGAAYIPSFNNLIATISPEIALMLQPIGISSESNGIKTEVVAAMNDNDMAVIYVTLKDLTDDRIDETLELYDYSLTDSHMFNSQIVDYDKKTNTVTLRIQGNGGKSLNDKKMNLNISSFLSKKQTFEAPVDINLSEIAAKSTQTVQLDMENTPGGGGDMYQKLKEQGVIQVLKPNETKINLPKIQFTHISNIGIINNHLHIQTKWTKDNVDDHGYFYFVDESGKEIYSSSINFGIDKTGDTVYGNEYTEYIFDRDNVDFEKQKLQGHFVSNGEYTTGNWNTTFKIQSVQDEISDNLNMNFETWDSNRFAVSPLGVTLSGNGKFNKSAKIDLRVKMNDGSVQTLDSRTSFIEDKKIKLKFIPSSPLEISKIKSILINGKEINI